MPNPGPLLKPGLPALPTAAKAAPTFPSQPCVPILRHKAPERQEASTEETSARDARAPNSPPSQGSRILAGSPASARRGGRSRAGPEVPPLPAPAEPPATPHHCGSGRARCGAAGRSGALASGSQALAARPDLKGRERRQMPPLCLVLLFPVHQLSTLQMLDGASVLLKPFEEQGDSQTLTSVLTV